MPSTVDVIVTSMRDRKVRQWFIGHYPKMVGRVLLLWASILDMRAAEWVSAFLVGVGRPERLGRPVVAVGGLTPLFCHRVGNTSVCGTADFPTICGWG